MSRFLVLCRHGNTFRDGEKVVMVGAREDVPLTEFGRAQAVAVGQSLKRSAIDVVQIIAGPLLRTREFAQIIAEAVDRRVSVVVDSRLTELDYGEWGGLSEEEICQKWGESELHSWQEEGVRPKKVAFSPNSQELEAEVRSLLMDMSRADGVTLLVTSNGRLREISRLLSGRSQKVKTGHMCLLVRSAPNSWKIVMWNAAPDEFSL